MAQTNPYTRLRVMQLCDFAHDAIAIEDTDATWAILRAGENEVYHLVLVGATRNGAEDALAAGREAGEEFLAVDLTAEPLDAFYDAAVIDAGGPRECHSWPTQMPFPARLTPQG